MSKKTVLLIALVLIVATVIMAMTSEADGRDVRQPTLTSLVSTPGSTPTPHAVYLPLVVDGQQGTATSTVVPLPTLTACVPTLTAAPTTTNTPTPTPTTYLPTLTPTLPITPTIHE